MGLGWHFVVAVVKEMVVVVGDSGEGVGELVLVLGFLDVRQNAKHNFIFIVLLLLLIIIKIILI